MRHIEQKSQEYDKKIAECNQRLSVALEESFPLKDIEKRLEQRILKFFQREYRKKFKLPLEDKDDLNQTRDLVTITRGASEAGGGRSFKPEERMLADLDVSDIEQIQYMQDANATMNLEAEAIRTLNQQQANPKGFSSGVSRQMMTKVIDKYKHKSMHTLYVLKPGSQDIYLLNFKQQSFAKERLQGMHQMPTRFNSLQLADGTIFLVGGLRGDTVVRSTYKIANDLNFTEVGNMKTARYNVPILLLKDQFILAAGGLTAANQRSKMTQATEIFDTKTHQWYSLAPLLKARGATSMTAIANRHVFIFNGVEGGPQQKHAIEYLDLGVCEPSSFKKARWEPVSFQSSDFHANEPRASA